MHKLLLITLIFVSCNTTKLVYSPVSVLPVAYIRVPIVIHNPASFYITKQCTDERGYISVLFIDYDGIEKGYDYLTPDEYNTIFNHFSIHLP